MRVVSLVPSWTETLLECGVDVVGRTRFCVHPEGKLHSIPSLGGTKDLDLEGLAALKPDLLLLDKEENLPWMAKSPCRVHCTHVEGLDDVPKELDALGAILQNANLISLSTDWRKQLESPAYPKEKIAELPGVLEWLRQPKEEPEVILYLIWRSPWMTIARNTFVGGMLTQVGFGGRIPAFPEKYPKIDLGQFDPDKTLLLFSSEPYPFGLKTKELRGLDFPSALVDGEAYSWFGLRSLRFLKALKS
jgi:ABC-type Fe3+-hydroxamate transport system substrate-binding protein